MESLVKKNLYVPAVYQECLARIDKISAATRPEWGKMTAAQMFGHCAEIQEVNNGSKPLENSPFIVKLFKGFIRKMVLSEKPYPRESKTHPQYEQLDKRDFDTEKTRLLASLASFYNTDKAKAASVEHPLFGKMTTEEKGWAMYKHLDHHLNQFGV